MDEEGDHQEFLAWLWWDRSGGKGGRTWRSLDEGWNSTFDVCDAPWFCTDPSLVRILLMHLRRPKRTHLGGRKVVRHTNRGKNEEWVAISVDPSTREEAQVAIQSLVL
jgi:hypothetical protein